MINKISNCGIGFFDSVDVCVIEETDVGNIQFFKENKKFDGDVTINFQIGETNKGEVFIRIQINMNGDNFYYEIHPQVTWLRLLCTTGKINITDTRGDAILVSFTMDVNILKKDMFQIPKCKDWFEGEFE